MREWFVAKFGSPTEPQVAGWPHIVAGRDTLISAPTGSGKTLAAFLACIDRLVRKALSGELRDGTEVLYVSPLKALGNDIQKNLELPLAEIQALAGAQGLLMPTIRTAVRTGDTLMRERRAMLKSPPHILVTTPESLYILLTADKSRATLREVETVIVDEIHAIADDKRGTHLALSLERLACITRCQPVRIGLSATQKPIEIVAKFLTGAGRPLPHIVNVGHARKLDLGIEVPGVELGSVASNQLWDEIYDRIVELSSQHRSTLVFVNTRKLAERVAFRLSERLGEEHVAAHHGSLARKLRLEAERKLKAGEVKVLVATASLELGIDIGHIDLVCQIGSPRAIAVALQRIGRAGHWRGATPKGRLFATTRDGLMECAALVRAIRRQELDQLIIPEAPLDILAQQIVAACAADEWNEEELFQAIRRAFPYRNLGREEFDKVLTMLADGISAKRGRYGAYLFRDQVNGRLRARRGARLAAITSGGAIPETALFTVVAMPEGTVIGTLEEDFAIESYAGDVLLLGNTSWIIRRVETAAGRVLVEDAHGAPPRVPFWLGEAPARTSELSQQVAELRQQISDLLPNTSPVSVQHHASTNDDVSEEPLSRTLRGITSSPEVDACRLWLKEECCVDDAAAEQMIAYVLEGRAVLGAVPTQKTIIAERFFDEGGGMQLVIHAPFGGRVNKAWGLALRKRFCRSFNFELQASATDDGLNISLAEQHSFPLADVFNFLQPESLYDVLQQAVLTGSPIFQTRWRWDANRSLALLRFQGGKKVPPQIQRMRSDDLLASVFPDVAACFENIEGEIQVPDHPLVTEVMKDVMHEAMDVNGLRTVLEKMRSGEIKTIAVDTPVPSQFSHEILNSNPYAFLDDAPLEERRARAVQLRRTLPASVLQEAGKLDPEAIRQVSEEARPDIRDADELHDLLQSLIAVPALVPNTPHPFARQDREPSDYLPHERWQNWMRSLLEESRAVIADVHGRAYWVASERAADFTTLFPAAQFETTPPALNIEAADSDKVLDRALLGWLQHTGPITTAKLSDVIGIDTAQIDNSLLRLEATGTILRGHFRESDAEAMIEWCDRRLLARIHRLTLGTLRKQIEPVTPAQFMRWLLRWQHVAPGTQLVGDRGLLDALQQLQGIEIPANAWERHVLSARVREYDGAALDQLCLMGTLGWGRLSPHPATLEDSTGRMRRIVPTSVAPITFFLREERDWMQPRKHSDDVENERGLSTHGREVLEHLRRRGASFLPEIVRGVAKSKAEVETALWELVAAGFVTGDGFENLRSLIDKRKAPSPIRPTRPRHASGRWSLLYGGDEIAHERHIEATCWMLLRRYGIVFRELLARETSVPRWRELQIGFRRLEDRGEIRGGRFVQGFVGEQFAMPIAVDSVREMRRTEPSGETITISAADPLNLVGIIVPGERVPAISGRTVAYRDGIFVMPEEEEPPAAREAAI